MKTRILLPLFVALLGLLSAPHRAQAQDDGLSRARSAFDQGQDFFQDAKYSEAAEQFKIAYAAKPFSQFLFNIGACYEKSNDYPQALSYYEKYLAEDADSKDAAKTKLRIDALKKAIDESSAEGSDPSQPSKAVTALENVVIPGFVVVLSTPPGASIYLDSRESEPLGTTPWHGSLAGKHTLLLDLKGHKSVEFKMVADANRMSTFDANLGEEDYLGNLEVTSNIPGSNVYLDSRDIGAQGQTPWRQEVKPGLHKIWVTREGYDVYESEVTVIAGETLKINAALSGNEVGYINVLGTGVEKYRILVDDKVLCERGPCRQPLSPGTHQVSIRREDYRSYNSKIDVQSKTEVTMRATLVPEPSRADAYVSYFLAAAFAGGGYYLGTKAEKLRDDLAAEIAAGNPPPDNNDRRFKFGLTTGMAYTIAADASYAMSAGSLLFAIYYTFRDKGKPSTGRSSIRAISFQPQLDPRHPGVGLAGTF